MNNLTRKDWSLIQTALENFSKAEQFTAGDAPIVQKARQRIAEVLGKVTAQVSTPLSVQTAPVTPTRKRILDLVARLDEEELFLSGVDCVLQIRVDRGEARRGRNLRLAAKVGAV